MKTTLTPDQIADMLMQWFLELYDSALPWREIEDELIERLVRRGVSRRYARERVRSFLQ